MDRSDTPERRPTALDPKASARSLSRRWWPLAAATLLGLVLLASLRAPANPTDEGFLLHGIHRVQAGQVPGADFFAYMPLRYWLGAAWSGEEPMGLLDLRVLELLLLWACLLCLILVLPRVSAHRWWICLAVIAAFVLAPGPWHKATELLATLAVAVIVVQAELQHQRHEWWAFLLGAGCGVAIGVRMELGIAMTALAAVLLLRGGKRSLAPLMAGLAIPIVAVGLTYAAAGAWGTGLGFYQKELTAALSGLVETTNPFLLGSASAGSELASRWAFVLASLAVLAVVGTSALLALRRDRAGTAPRYLAGLAVVRLVPLLHDFDASHLLQAMPTAYLAAASLLKGHYRAVGILLLVGAHMATGLMTNDPYYSGRWRPSAQSLLPDSGVLAGIYTPAHQLELVAELERRMAARSPSTGLAAVPYAPLYVCLTGDRNPLPSDFFFPGSSAAAGLAHALRNRSDEANLPDWLLIDRSVLDSSELLAIRGDRYQLGAAIEENGQRDAVIDGWLLYRTKPAGRAEEPPLSSPPGSP